MRLSKTQIGWLILFFLFAVSVTAIVVEKPVPVSAAPTMQVWDEFIYLPFIIKTEDPMVQGVLDIVNVERAKVGCGPLKLESRLVDAAEGHAVDMAENDFFAHDSPTNGTPWARIAATGYSYSRAAENIAAGYSSPTSVMNGWMNSSGHRGNILDCGFTEIGIGYHYINPDTGTENWYHYWVQVFATPN